MQEFLSRALYEVSNLLLLPVIVALLFMLGWTVILAGGLAAEYLRRRKNEAFRKSIDALIDKNENDFKTLIPSLVNADKSKGITNRFLTRAGRIEKDALSWAKLVDDIDIYCSGIITKCSVGVKIGPMLGLMGALIPLGPALTALSHGDINKLANHMTIAFTTTVIGLLIGGASYVITQVRRKWYAQDMSDVKYIYELSFRE